MSHTFKLWSTFYCLCQIQSWRLNQRWCIGFTHRWWFHVDLSTFGLIKSSDGKFNETFTCVILMINRWKWNYYKIFVKEKYKANNCCEDWHVKYSKCWLVVVRERDRKYLNTKGDRNTAGGRDGMLKLKWICIWFKPLTPWLPYPPLTPSPCLLEQPSKRTSTAKRIRFIGKGGGQSLGCLLEMLSSLAWNHWWTQHGLNTIISNQSLVSNYLFKSKTF